MLGYYCRVSSGPPGLLTLLCYCRVVHKDSFIFIWLLMGLEAEHLQLFAAGTFTRLLCYRRVSCEHKGLYAGLLL